MEARGIQGALIGAVAMSVYDYVRATEDIDLAICVDPFGPLTHLASDLRSLGFEAELNVPDAEDALGGVLNIRRPDIDLIQLVNFLNPFTGGGAARLARHAVSTAAELETLPVPVVSLPALIALKLYAGGPKSFADALELVRRNPDLSRDELRTVCSTHGLGAQLDGLLAAIDRG